MTLTVSRRALTIGSAMGLLACGHAASPLCADCLRFTVQLIAIPCAFSVPQSLAINEAGQIAGYVACRIGDKNGFFWDGRSSVMLPSASTATDARAMGLSDSGDVVGWTVPPDLGPVQAFLYSDGRVSQLPPLPGADYAEAYAVAGRSPTVAVGLSRDEGPGFTYRAVVWTDGVPRALELPVGPNSQANDLNSAGLICGWMGIFGTTESTAFIWDHGDVSQLPAPRVDGAPAVACEASALNDLGDACGICRGPIAFPTQPKRAVLWTRSLTPGTFSSNVLEGLPGFVNSFARDVNSARVVVGYCEMHDGPNRACVWHDGKVEALEDLVPSTPPLRISSASSINESGQIVANGGDLSTGVNYALILTPVPPIPGDLNCDWAVAGDDLAILLGAWGRCPTDADAPMPIPCDADLNDDGAVDGGDLAILLGNWGIETRE